MNSRSDQIVLLGGALLFAVLVVLFSFEIDITGKATSATRVNITGSTPANCSVVAGIGRNSVSWPCIVSAHPLGNLVNGTGILAMYQYVPGSSDPWRVHNPNLDNRTISDLSTLSRRPGYVLLLSAPRTFNVSGFIATSTNVPLVQGWNLVGYPTLIVRNVSSSLSSIDNFTEARTYNNSGGVYLTYLNPGGGTLTLTIPGEGYWINATQGATWTVQS